MKILVTSGGTGEPIDAVRQITNNSTGRTGAFLADYLAEQGHQVTLLRAVGALPGEALTHTYITTADLGEALEKLLTNQHFDAVVHAAAVSDFGIESIELDGADFTPDRNVKLPSAESMTLRLKRNPKLVNRIKEWSVNPSLTLVAFKLTQAADEAEAREKSLQVIAASGADFVVQNDMAKLASTNHHPFRIFTPSGAMTAGSNKPEMAMQVNAILEKSL